MGLFIVLVMAGCAISCYACCVIAGRVDDATEREMSKNK